MISPHRTARPRDTTPDSEHTLCPFCPGNEHLTAAEIDRIDDETRQWLVRTVFNKYPVLGPQQHVEIHYQSAAEDRHRVAANGHHEVVIESRQHNHPAGTMPVAQMRRVLEMYVRRYRVLAGEDSSLRQIVIFRNYGRQAGMSLQHPHSQIIATPVVAPAVRRRMAGEIAFFDRTGGCGRCWLLERETGAGDRVVHRSARFITLAPYASKFPYHLQIIPLRHCSSFHDIEAAELDDLAAHLNTVLAALARCAHDPHYNLTINTPPLDQIHASGSHYFIEIIPRIVIISGFELSSYIMINECRPEQAAADMRACLVLD
jgi:UDPglucose--hexose-1-phosphate uridylyltransferase